MLEQLFIDVLKTKFGGDWYGNFGGDREITTLRFQDVKTLSNLNNLNLLK